MTQKLHNSVTPVFSTNYEPFGVSYGASGTDPSVNCAGERSQAVGHAAIAR